MRMVKQQFCFIKESSLLKQHDLIQSICISFHFSYLLSSKELFLYPVEIGYAGVGYAG